MEIAFMPVKPGTLSADDKAALRDAGVVVVEHEAPETLRLLRPAADLDSSEMLLCAMQALCDDRTSHTSVHAAFTRAVGAALNAKKMPNAM